MKESESGETLPHEDGRPRRPGAPPPRAHLYLALECDRPSAGAARASLADVDQVAIGRGADRLFVRAAAGSARTLTVQVPDRWMSARHVQLSRVLGKWVVEDAGSRNGTKVAGEPLTEKRVLKDGDVCELGHTLFVYRDAVPTAPDDPLFVDSPQLAAPAPGLATLIPPLARQFAALRTVARSPVSVLVRGESGTGKELVARAVHALSLRPGSFVAMNCGALPDTLVESELFGHKKGAFSGASEDRPGLVRAADRGTLFLDEIGDLPAPSQAAFLRVLQEREVQPLGATRPQPVDLRLVAATHRDLDELERSGEFRGDLLQRLGGFTLSLPPLAERREELGLLLAALLERMAPGRTVRLSVDAGRALALASWPGNVRELEKCLGAALVLAGEGVVELEHLPESVRQGPVETAPSRRPLTDEETRHKAEIESLLAEHQGNVSAVARATGKARMQVHRWLKRYGLSLDDYRK